MLLCPATPGHVLLLCIALLTYFGAAQGKARFMSHVPYDEERELSENYEDDHSYDDIHDSISKLRGRHYPKLSYTPITGTAQISHQFREFAQTVGSDSRFRLTSPTSETTEIDGPRSLPLEIPPREGSRRRSKYPTKSSTSRFLNGRTVNRFGEYSPGYPHNPNPYSQNDEEHRQARDKWKSSANVAEESASEEEDIGPSPRFARTMKRNVTTRSGDTAELVCHVVNRGHHSVSWFRPGNLNILTVGTFRYSTDQRLSVSHTLPHHRLPLHQEEWALRIRNVTEQDAGLYECQISTTPLLSYVVNLIVSAPGAPSAPALGDRPSNTASLTRPGVEEPWAEFPEGPAVLVLRGSALHLQCWVTHHHDTPVLVNWYHQDQILYPSVESLPIEQAPQEHHSPLLSDNLSKDNKVFEAPHPTHGLTTSEHSVSTLREGRSVQLHDDISEQNSQYYKQQFPHQQQYQHQIQQQQYQHQIPQQQHQHQIQQQQHQSQHHLQQLERPKPFSASLHADKTGLPDYPTDDTKSYGLGANTRDVRADAPDKQPTKDTTRTRFSLLVGLATAARAGRYTCAPVGGKNASVMVHVVAGSDLMLTDSSPAPSLSPLTTMLTLASLALWGLLVLT